MRHRGSLCTMSIVIQFYPNGEFSQGVDTSSNRHPDRVCKRMQMSPPSAGITNADILKVQAQSADIPYSVYSQKGSHFATSQNEIYILEETTDKGSTLRKQGDISEFNTIHTHLGIGRLVHLGILKPLVHPTLESCEKRQSRKRLASMTKRMSRSLRNGAYLLQKQPGGKDVLSFLTLTLPGLSDEGLASCCANWDAMVKRFFDWLRIKCKNNGMDLQHVYCTEIQLKRLENRGEYAPHLHVVYRGRATLKHPWIITPKQARKQWARCIRAFVNEKFDTSALENLRRVKHSAAGYLGKYLSKGHQLIPETDGGNPIQQLKTQWGGMARTLSKDIRKNIQRFIGKGDGGHIAHSILDCMDEIISLGYVRYFRKGFIPTGIDKSTGLEYGLHVGCGCLQTPTFESGLIPLMDYIFAID